MKRLSKILPLVVIAFILLFTSCQRLGDTEYTGKDVTSGESDAVDNTEQQALNLITRDNYPVPFARTDGFSMLYGYLDKDGNPVIEPQFLRADPFFECGAAIVTSIEGKAALIDRKGKFLVEPRYDYFIYSEGLFITYDPENKVCVAFDETGKKLFETQSYISEYSEGLAPAPNGSPGGYLDKSGKYALTLDYNYLGPFVNGLAEVSSEYLGPLYLIDRTGADMTDKVSSGLRMFKDSQSNKFGYKNSKGEIVIPAKFNTALPFLNGYAIVGVAVDTEEIFGIASGIIDTQGNFVLEPVYTGIRRMKNGLFSVGEELTGQNFVPVEDILYYYNKKAVFSPELKKLSDWEYYSVEDSDGNYICVSDGSTVSFYDKEFNKANDMPVFKGHGYFKKDGNLLRGELNYSETVADLQGNIWAGPCPTHLGDGITARTDLHSLSPAANFVYPVFSGIKNQEVQNRINNLIEHSVKELCEILTRDALKNAVHDTSYTLARKKDLLVIDYKWFGYTLGSAHGGSDRSIYYINLKTGNQYKSLTELIKPDLKDEALSFLSKVVSDRMKEDIDIYWEDHVRVTPETRFALSDDGITIYFGEYEIAAYAAGMPEFFIPYSDLTKFIDTESDFWKAFN